jgi:hypothetical protein
LGQVTSGRSTPARGFSFDVTRPQEPKVSTKDGKEAWATDAGDSLPESEYTFINVEVFAPGLLVIDAFFISYPIFSSACYQECC